HVPNLSPAVEAVVMRALSKNVLDRYPSVLQFAEELEKAINQPANVANALPNDPNNIIILPQLPAPQAGQSGGGPDSQALPTFLAGAGAPNQVGGTPESQLSAQLAGNQAGVAPDPQAQSSSPVRTPPNNQAGGVPESPILGPLSAVIPPVNQAGAMPEPQIPGGAGGNQAGAAPEPQAQSPFLDVMPPAIRLEQRQTHRLYHHFW